MRNLIKMSAADMTINELGYAMVGTDSAISSLTEEVVLNNHKAFANTLNEYLKALEVDRLTAMYTVEVNEKKADLLCKWRAMQLHLKAKRCGLGTQEEKNAAQKALTIMQEYGDPQKGTTEAMNNIINVVMEALGALDDNVLAQADLNEWLKVVAKANNDFLEAIKKRELFKASIEKGAVRKWKLCMYKVYNAICNEIESRSVYNPSEEIDELISQLNQMAISTNAKIAARKTKKENNVNNLLK